MPQSSYLSCATQRSGSTLLGEGLTSTGVAGRPAEYFNFGLGEASPEPPWKDDFRTKPLAEYLAIAFRHGSTANGVFASKLQWWQLTSLAPELARLQGGGDVPPAERLARAFGEPRYIWVTRRDKIRQAVSLFRAKQSHAWHSLRSRESSATPAFSFHLIDAALRQIVQEEALWAHFFDEAGITPHTVVYEDLAADYAGTIRGVLRYLDIPFPADAVIPPTRMRKLADELSEEWVQRYYAGDRARHRRRLLLELPAALVNEPLREAYLRPRLQRMRGQISHLVKRLWNRAGR